jgi:hypothetical protein
VALIVRLATGNPVGLIALGALVGVAVIGRPLILARVRTE